MNALEQLIGQHLIATTRDNGETQLSFSNARLSAYNPITGDALQNCVGAKVTSVEIIERQALRLTFGNGSQFLISLKETDYVGPEAYCAWLGDGAIVVE